MERPAAEPGQGHGTGEDRPARPPWRLIALAALVIGLAAAWPFLQLGERLVELRAWVASLGPLTPVAFGVLATLAMLAAAPASAVAVAAGIVLDPLTGVLVITVAENAAAEGAYLIARYVAREDVRARLARYPRLWRIDGLVAANGWPAVAFTRLVPAFPYALTSYAFGLTGVPFVPYAVATALASFPGTVFYVVGGDGLVELIAQGTVSPVLLVVLVVALGAGLAAYAWVRRRVRMPGA